MSSGKINIQKFTVVITPSNAFSWTKRMEHLGWSEALGAHFVQGGEPRSAILIAQENL